MSHEPECPSPDCTEKCPGYEQCDHQCVCEFIRAAYKRGREDALKPVRELADKFEREGIHYRLAAARVYSAIGAAARGGEQE